jgi:hypothetical protein
MNLPEEEPVIAQPYLAADVRSGSSMDTNTANGDGPRAGRVGSEGGGAQVINEPGRGA